MRYADFNTPQGGEYMKFRYRTRAKFLRNIKGQINNLLEQVIGDLIVTVLAELILHIILSK